MAVMSVGSSFAHQSLYPVEIASRLKASIRSGRCFALTYPVGSFLLFPVQEVSHGAERVLLFCRGIVLGTENGM